VYLYSSCQRRGDVAIRIEGLLNRGDTLWRNTHGAENSRNFPSRTRDQTFSIGVGLPPLHFGVFFMPHTPWQPNAILKVRPPPSSHPLPPSFPAHSQVLRAILENPADSTRLSLLYAARTPEDLLLFQEMNVWAERDDRFQVRPSLFSSLPPSRPLYLPPSCAPTSVTFFPTTITIPSSLPPSLPSSFPPSQVPYTVDVPPSSWPYSSGFITAEMLRKHLPTPSPHLGVLICGPPPMVTRAVKPNLLELGFTEEQFFEF